MNRRLTSLPDSSLSGRLFEQLLGADLSGLRAFHADQPKVPLAIICDAAEPHELDGVRLLPWGLYFQELAKIMG